MRSSLPDLIAAAAPRLASTFVLDCGLECCLMATPASPIVATAIAYRVGSRDEPLAHAGIAHFLEHMMFKGSRGFGPGEIDRLTQKWGGSNNAFTSRDTTLYHFEFAVESWRQALAIEADRMAGLDLDPEALEAERQVIHDEIAMVREDPWESLSEEVESVFFGPHPYAHPVIGDNQTLNAVGRSDLLAFYRRYYRPTNAVLVVVGDLVAEDRHVIEESFASIERCSAPRRPRLPPATQPERERVETGGGDVARMLLALPAPATRDPEAAGVLALSVLLAGGRSGRLVHELVEVEQLCTWISVDPFDAAEAGLLLIAAEATPGVAPERVEARVMEELAKVGDAEVGERELERVRNQLVADWVFDHQRSGQRAFSSALAMASFDLDFPRRRLLAALDYDQVHLRSLAREVFASRSNGVVGWSLP